MKTLSHSLFRFVQQEVALRSYSATSLSFDLDVSGGSRTNLNLGSLDSIHFSNFQFQSALSVEAMELLHFVASRDAHRPPWPFAGDKYPPCICVYSSNHAHAVYLPAQSIHVHVFRGCMHTCNCSNLYSLAINSQMLSLS